MMRPRFYILCAILLLMIPLGLSTGERFYYLIFIIGTAVMLLSLLYIFVVRVSFNFMQSLTTHSCMRGESVPYNLLLENSIPIPYARLLLDLQVPSAHPGDAALYEEVALSPLRERNLSRDIPCEHCGRYTIGLNKISFADPFDLFLVPMSLSRMLYFNERGLGVTVLPRIYPITHIPLPVQENEGEHSFVFFTSEEPPSLSEVRTFQMGDPIRRIHWKLSASRQKLLTKRYETSSQSDVLVLVDVSGAHAVLADARVPQAIDMALESAASVCSYFSGAEIAMRLVSYSPNRLEVVAERQSDFSRLYEALTLLAASQEEGEAYPLAQIIKQESSSMGRDGALLLITNEIDDDTFDALVALSLREMRLFVVLCVHPYLYARDLSRYQRISTELLQRGIGAIVLEDASEITERMAMLK